MTAPKIPASTIYTAKVEALLKLVAPDFTEADFLALACAAADQAGAESETSDRIHEFIRADMQLNAILREREAGDAKAKSLGACPVCGETNRHVCGVES